MRLLVLEDRIPWFGRFSGYGELLRHLPAGVEVRRFHSRPGWGPRLRGKAYSLRHGLGPGPQAEVDALRRFAAALAADPAALGHVLHGEHFLRYLARLPEPLRRRMLVTLHQPPGQWTPEGLTHLQTLPQRLLLFTPLSGKLPAADRLLHGVDTGFFSPGAAPRERRVLYSGVHLRDLPMLERIVEALLVRDASVLVDMLVPLHRRDHPVLRRLARHERLVWHAGLDEHALLALYRRCRTMLLPLLDSGANTAVVEALACGLPLVTTDVGGIRDYGAGSVYPVVAPGDDAAALTLLHTLLEDDAAHAAASVAARAFASAHLAWPRIAAQHVALYHRLAA